MAFIGIIVENKESVQMKRILENALNREKRKYTIIVLNEKNIENMQTVRFETILITNLDKFDKKDNINKLIENTKYLIINSDIEEQKLEFINNLKLNVITFGFNQKASITASSVEEKLMICIQRKVVDMQNKEIEPQEIMVDISKEKLPKSTHNLIGIASILLIYGKKEIFF